MPFIRRLFVAPTERPRATFSASFIITCLRRGRPSAFLRQLHRVGAISGGCEAVIAARRKMDCDCAGDCRCIAPFIPQVGQELPTGIYPSSVATTMLLLPVVYLLIGKYFPGRNLDVLAVTTAEVGVVFCTIVLVTGPIWARPVWGIWWAPGTSALPSRSCCG